VEIFASQGAPPISMTPVASFATSFASVVDIGGKFATAGLKVHKNENFSGFDLNFVLFHC
jgi:hypothetical protein